MKPLCNEPSSGPFTIDEQINNEQPRTTQMYTAVYLGYKSIHEEMV